MQCVCVFAVRQIFCGVAVFGGAVDIFGAFWFHATAPALAVNKAHANGRNAGVRGKSARILFFCIHRGGRRGVWRKFGHVVTRRGGLAAVAFIWRGGMATGISEQRPCSPLAEMQKRNGMARRQGVSVRNRRHGLEHAIKRRRTGVGCFRLCRFSRSAKRCVRHVCSKAWAEVIR